MATYYINPSGGNDANNGTSLVSAWKTITNGATAVRIAPGDEIRIMESSEGARVTAYWKSQNSNRRISGTITGATNATPIVVTSAAHGLSSGNTVSISGVLGNTNANGVWEISSVTTDTFTLVSSAGNASYTSGGTFADISSSVIKYDAAMSQDISFCGNNGQAKCANWTASANVTSSVNLFGTGAQQYIREGNCSLKLQLSSSFLTGKAAYQQISGGPLNLSAYDSITFQIAKESSAIGTNEYKIVLCSDTAGATIVDEFVVPASLSPNNMVPFRVVKNGGGGLGSSIRSVALYKIQNNSTASTIYIDNIVAVKNGYPFLTSLVNAAKNDGSFTDAYAIMSINNNRLVLLNGPVSIACDPNNPPYGWFDLTGDNMPYGLPTMSIEPFYIDSISGSSPLCIVNDSGTAGNLITFQGGYDQSTMTGINGKTYFASLSGYNTVFSSGANNYLQINNIGAVRAEVGFEFSCNNSVIQDCSATNMSSTGLSISACSNNTFTSTFTPSYTIQSNAAMSAAFCMQNGFLISGGSTNNTFNSPQSLSCFYNFKYGNNFNEFNGLLSCNGIYGFFMYLETTNGPLDAIINNSILSSNSVGVQFDTSSTFGTQFNYINLYDCTTAIATSSTNSGIVFNNISTSGNTNTVSLIDSVITMNGGRIGYPTADTASYFSLSNSEIYLNRIAGVSSTDPINISAGNISTAYLTDCVDSSQAVFSGNYGPYCSNLLVSTPVHGSTTKSWKMSVGNGSAPWAKTEDAPLILPVAKIAVESNKTVTVSAWFRREDAAISAKLVLPSNQLLGIEAAVSSAMTAAINTWEQISISFTPYMNGVVEIQAQAYGSSTSALYVGDMSVATANPSIVPSGYYIGGSCDGGYSSYAGKLIYSTEISSNVAGMAVGMPSNTSSGVSTTSHGYGAQGTGGGTSVLRFNYVYDTYNFVSTAYLAGGPINVVNNTSSTSGYFAGGTVYVVGAGYITSLARWKFVLATEVSYQLSNLPNATDNSNSGGCGSATNGYIPSGSGIMKFSYATDVVSTTSATLNNSNTSAIDAGSSAFYCAGYTSVCSNACQEFAYSTDTLSSLGFTTTIAASNMATTWNTSNGYLYGGSCYDGSGKIPRTDCYTTIDKVNISAKTISALSATCTYAGLILGLNCG